MVALTAKFSRQKDKILTLQVTYSQDLFAKKLSDWNHCKIWKLQTVDKDVFVVQWKNIRLNAEKGFKSKLRKSGSWE